MFMDKRNTLSIHKQDEINNKVKEQLLQYLSSQIKTVHVYLPISSKKEIDTWPIIRHLWRKKISVAVPVVSNDRSLLASYELAETTTLVDNSWKVPEPIDGKLIDDKDLDLVIVPLLAFDLKGYRVGYGKGFYDKFLATLDRKVLKIGLCHFKPIDKISNTDSWDISLDCCITPYEIFRF